MKAAAFDYHRPASVDAAVGMLAELGDEAKVLAGGQSLVPVMAMRLGRPVVIERRSLHIRSLSSHTILMSVD